MVALVNWCVKRGMMIENPLRVVDKLNERADRREVSRALIPEEFERLLRATPDEDRRLYYLMAGRTGLRWSEIRRLRWQDLDLQAGWIFLDAASTKAKRDDTLPIAPDLLALLGERKKSMGPIFSSSPTRPTFQRDVARAGLQYDNARGQVDRKSLRKTFGTHLALAGVDFRLAVKLMRHTDPKLTQNIYTDPLLLDMQGAVKKLVPRTIQKAVGESHG
jgi:integrase